MLRAGILLLALTPAAMADGFTFAIASPVAAQDFRFKTATFVFRTEGCAEPAKAEVSAMAEGIVNGMRRSFEMKVMQGAKPGIYAVYQSWPSDGQWVVSLKGTCGNLTAGALVPVGPKGFDRENSKFLPKPAVESEIERAIKTAPKGDGK